MLRWTRSFFRRDGAGGRAGSAVVDDEAAAAAAAATALGGIDAFEQAGTLDLLRGAALAPPGTGDVVDRWRLGGVIGQGSTGVVFRAVDVVTGGDVAVKLLLRRLADRSYGPAGEAADEAAPALSLRHPNIARVFLLERHGRWPYLVMEHLAGDDLHRSMKRRRRHRLPLAEILRVGTSTLDALSYAHSCGVLHNDVKPSNLILTHGGAVKLCDFGLSRLAESSPGAWLAATSSGAPAFMCPERIRGEPCSVQSDLYSVAATLYTLAAGRTLFGAEMAQAWRGHLELEPEPTPDVPAPLFQLLRRALAKDPSRRFESAAEMHAALVQAFADMDDDDDAHAGSSAARPVSTAELVRASMPAPPPLREAPPAGMVLVPATRLGSRHGGVHQVRSFWMAKAPVTNAEWKRFVDATGEPPPAHWLGGRLPAAKGDHPVVGVSLDAARRYARFAGMRLPSDVEWEAAARGGDGRAFPWGGDYDAARANGPEAAANDTVAVDAFGRAGASSCGCVDMVGNAWEWTEPVRAAHAPDDGFAWVFGGSFRHPCAQGGGIARAAVAVDKEYLYLGFRCARDEEDLP